MPLLIRDARMFVNHFVFHGYLDTMALSVAGYLKEFCMSRVVTTEQAKPSFQQLQATVNGGFTDQILQKSSQDIFTASGGAPVVGGQWRVIHDCFGERVLNGL